MLRIRLRRMGKKKQPSYRVVVADSRAPRDGAFVEVVGYYNPRTEPATVEIDTERAKLWLARGAQPSDRVARLLAAKGVIEAPPAPNRPKGANKKGAAEAPSASPASAEPAAKPAGEAPAGETAEPE
jgi:small subunit ribosomal protein S16